MDAAYEKRSIALASNLHPAGFDELMPKTIANATIDRLLHHAHIVLTAGDSIRLTQATAGKGVTPPTNQTAGRTPSRQRATLLAASGQIPLAVDRQQAPQQDAPTTDAADAILTDTPLGM